MNKAEKAAYMRDYRKKNPDRTRNIELKKQHGIDLDTYNAILAAQDFKCAICGVGVGIIGTGNASKGNLCVDHVHDGGHKIRGLLCTKCNLGIGSFQDNIEILQKAIKYLQAHEDRLKRISEVMYA